MTRQFRRIDPKKAYPLARTIERVAINDPTIGSGVAINHRRAKECRQPERGGRPNQGAGKASRSQQTEHFASGDYALPPP
jgi:hypothetical protein